MSGAGDVVCEGWLRKSPPEKKLRRYVSNSSFKKTHSKPVSDLIVDVDAGLSFTKKELESSFVFDLRTEERTWYLVAESEEDMNRWVTSICLLCGFNPTDDGTPSISMVTGSIPPPYDPVSVRHLEHDSSLQDANYVPMTPLTSTQVPPPAHMGFRNSTMNPVIPSTPPARRNTMNSTVAGEAEVMPPPVHRNLKPQRKVKPAPLEITPVSQDWQEVPPPVRSPVTRTFTRGPSTRGSFRPSSAQSSSPSSDSDDPDDSYVTMLTSSLSHSAGEQVKHRLGGAGSPLLHRGKAEKQVEYLDLDLHTGRSTPTRQLLKLYFTLGIASYICDRRRVDYVVVDPKRTKALKNTREAWHDGRMSTEKEKS
uniref:PH domain-containing protein n=1 Tax=Fundulus heteroclitus TaxID=8078 RepID=A0A3Q2UP27_FUNHE